MDFMIKAKCKIYKYGYVILENGKGKEVFCRKQKGNNCEYVIFLKRRDKNV